MDAFVVLSSATAVLLSGCMGFVATPSSSTEPSELSLSTASLPNGEGGTAYSAKLTASGGTSPYTWSLASGSLPSGLTLNASSGQISGMPTQSGSFSFTIQVKDSSSTPETASKAFSVTIAANAVAPSITAQPANPTVPAGQTATFSVTASGTPPLTYQSRRTITAISAPNSATHPTPPTRPSPPHQQLPHSFSS